MVSKLIDKVRNVTQNPAAVITSAVLVTAAGLATREVAVASWRLVNGEHPPRDPSRPDVSWPTAIAWSTALGVTVGLARLATRRALHTDA